MSLLLATLLWEKYMWRVIKFQSNLFKLYLISWSEVLNKKEMNWGIILKGNEAIVVFITRKFLNFLSTHFPMVNKTFHMWIVVISIFKVCLSHLSLALSLKQGSTGAPSSLAHLRRTLWDVSCGLDVVALASPNEFFFNQCGPDTVRNRTQYGPKYLLKKH